MWPEAVLATQLQGFSGLVFRLWDFKVDCAFIAARGIEVKYRRDSCVWRGADWGTEGGCGITKPLDSDRAGFKSWFCHLLAESPWASHFILLSLNFLMCKLVMTLGESCRLNKIIYVKHLAQYMA